MSLILPFDTDRASLDNAGGKGLNLVRLTRAGFDVPPGFIVTTAAYRAFVAAHALDEVIARALPPSPDRRGAGGEVAALEAASAAIRAAFAQSSIPAPIVTAIRDAYTTLSDDSPYAIRNTEYAPVAVRSSATAEDLPGFSFAGQQDTFLNVIGLDALTEAVVACWSSLWTARAIGYRARNAIPHAGVALAVVVQRMVAAEASGVLFTANPLTGQRDEAVIDATLGLGEALVAGHVEPDHYVLEPETGRILDRVLGAKAVAIYGQAEGGTVTREIAAADRSALADAHLRELARLGMKIEARFESPQDIEWAFAEGRLHILQTRPITTLYPLPAGLSSEPLSVLLSFGALQGMLDPMTPLGRDTIAGLMVGGARLFGYHASVEKQILMQEAGARLWVNLTGALNNRRGRKFILRAFEFIDPAAMQILQTLLEAGDWPPPGRLRLRTFLHVVSPFPALLARMLPTLLRPDARREALLRRLDAWIAEDCAPPEAAARDLSVCAAWMRRALASAFPRLFTHLTPCFGSGMAGYVLLSRFTAAVPEAGVDSRALLRGLPHNVTTEMDLALWQTAQALRADAEIADYCSATDAHTLAEAYLAGQLPSAAQEAVAGFLERYGMRGLGEIDLGRPRWRDDPTPLFQTLQSYLQFTDAELAPDAVFARGAQAAEADIERLIAALRQTRLGWLKARIARLAARRMRALVGLRETPKFTIIRMFGKVRELLLANGAALVAAGVLEQPDDVFFLHLTELETLTAQPERDWRGLVAERRLLHAQEQRRKQIPRVLLSDGRAFYEGLAGSSEGELVGSPVSPGVVEGVVRVIRDPRGAQLAPGEILVCPGTDPAWTPLFLAAGGLVMEVGGMMTHGAVVAREYGLPAVVGVHEATTRLQTGQRVRVDGTTGQVTLLDEAPEG